MATPGGVNASCGEQLSPPPILAAGRGLHPSGRLHPGEGGDAPLPCSVPLRCTAAGFPRFPGWGLRIPADACWGGDIGIRTPP